MNTFSNPSELRAFVVNLAGELARDGLPEAAERLRAAANFPAGTSSEWLGELGLAVREVQQKHSPPKPIQDALERVMSAVHTAWPRL
jgi:hypothetical protein